MEGGAGMEISLGAIIFLVILALYAWNEHNNQVLELKRKKYEQEQEIKRLQVSQTQSAPQITHAETTHKVEREIVHVFIPAEQPLQSPSPALPSAKTFVQVIFKKNGKKRYDYYLGDNYDVRVGDFVEVYAYDKWSRKSRLRIAKVLYISSPGETSAYAKTEI